MTFIKITSGVEIVEKERLRLINLPNTDPNFKTWLGDRTYPLDWMKKQFGETLIERDGFKHAGGQEFDNYRCSICERVPDKNEKFIHFVLDEKINICKICVLGMKSILLEAEQ